MLVKAIICGTPCYVNTEYITDYFEEEGHISAYLATDGTACYKISKEDFEKILESEGLK